VATGALRVKNHFLLLSCDDNSRRRGIVLSWTIGRASRDAIKDDRAETLHGNDVRLGLN
jgi:hypothetical protein